MNIIVIVVTYNGKKWVEKCFSSLINSSIPLKILAIDNASSDGTPELIREKYPQVVIIETGSNLGFGKANNIGLRKAMEDNVDYFFLLNQDAFIERDSIESLVKISKSHPEYGILSPIHLNGSGDALEYSFSNFIIPQRCPDFISDVFIGHLKEIYPITFVNAAAWLLTNRCVKKVGEFDPIFPHYGEDDDYVSRTLYHGFKVGIVPVSRIFHDSFRKTRSNIAGNETRLIIRNIVQLKHYPNSFISNMILLLINEIHGITALITYRQFKYLKLRVKALFKTLLMTRKIIKSKAFYKKPQA